MHLLSVDLLFEHLDLVFQRLLQVQLLLLGESGALIDALDLHLDFLVALFEVIVLGVERIHIVEQRVVLLLSLNERRHNLFDVRNASGLLDLIESVLNDLDVSQVLVHELSLLLVRLDDLVEAATQDHDGVRELSLSLLLGGLSSFSLLLLFLLVEANSIFVTLLQRLMVVGDLTVEMVLLFFILGLQSDDLNSGVLSDTADLLETLVLLFGANLDLSDVL